MSPSEIEELLDQEPFLPIRFTLASGDQYVLNNRHRAIVVGLSLAMGLSENPETRIGERLKLLSIPNIVMAEQIDPERPRGRRRR